MDPCIEVSHCYNFIIEGNGISNKANVSTHSRAVSLYSCGNFQFSKNKIDSDSEIDYRESGIEYSLNLYNCTGPSYIVNNFFMSAVSSRGLYIDSSSDINIYFNSLVTYDYLTSNIEIKNSNSIKYYNNINATVQSGNWTEKPYTISNSTILSDYNNFYHLNLHIARVNGTAIGSLPALIAATQNDTHSNVAAVQFVSNSDLHLAGASIGNNLLKGIPIAGITEDIDGNPRDPFAPYKGADEPQVPPINLTLHLTAFIQGFYNNISNTQVSDTVTVYLRTTISPYLLTDSAIAVLNSAGTTDFSFPGGRTGSYYIVVKHRNSIETWSKNGIGVLRDTTINYNFSIAVIQAYGNNLKQIDTSPVVFGIYSGDVNQDGVIDVLDAGPADNDSYNFVTGYVNTDVNGDNVVDTVDLSIIDNNAFNFVRKITPP